MVTTEWTARSRRGDVGYGWVTHPSNLSMQRKKERTLVNCGHCVISRTYQCQCVILWEDRRAIGLNLQQRPIHQHMILSDTNECTWVKRSMHYPMDVSHVDRYGWCFFLIFWRRRRRKSILYVEVSCYVLLIIINGDFCFIKK